MVKFPGYNPGNMQVMKYFAKVIGHRIKAKLEAKLVAKPDDDKKKKKRVNMWSVGNKMRRFYNMWKWQMYLNTADGSRNRWRW